jgi:hypothetical protein
MKDETKTIIIVFLASSKAFNGYIISKIRKEGKIL